MGVPSFYRWLTKKYESIVVDVKEENGECVDSSLPNPNGMEFDNLYLDMNAIIHPCFHPEDNDDMGTPKTFEDVFNNIFGYIDRLFNIVRPRKLLYLAIDGVAPRGKMNQQRTRRFRNSKEAEEVEKEEERLRREFLLDGKQVLPKQETELFDTNIISPGTEFMYKLSKELQTYVQLRMKNNPGWKNVKVILSDSSVPGEGESKIFSFIRLQRTFPEYDPNTRHCVYGLDADLIMLALATHEIRFSILREDIMAQLPNSGGHTTQVTASCEPENMTKSMKSFEKWGETEVSEKSSSEGVYKAKKSAKRPYKFLHTWILREYLKMDMEIHDPPEKFQPDFERLVDDFIFICFFSGNDFLPRMPSLYIHEGGIDLLMHVYKTEFKVLGGYLVDVQRVNDKKSGYIKLKRVENFILLVGNNYEENIFKKRADLRERILKKTLKEYENSRCAENEDFGTIRIDLSTLEISGSCSERMHKCSIGVNDPEVILENTKELKDKLKEYTRKAADSFQNGGLRTDKVKLHLPGYRERYYMEKFELTSSVDIESTRRAVVEKYTEGLCWVTLYYFAGVPSWTWYYPYHYGPFASDMKGLSQVKPYFQKGLPFKPFEQLMGVFPPRSAHALPIPYQRLMKDETSSIIDFYRTDFQVDVDGMRFTWQGICKLPFIEETRLLAETRKLESELKADEAIRNSEGLDILFVGASSQIISEHQSIISNKDNNEIKIDAKLSGGLNGLVLLKMGKTEVERLPQCDSDILCVFYKLPPHRMHNPRLLEGVIIPEETITETDIHETQLWHEYQGHRPITGLQNPHRQWKADKKVTNSTPAVIMKNAGIGWGKGRGKVLSEEAEGTSSVPGDVQKLTLGLNFGANSSSGHFWPHNFNSPSQRDNEKWRPTFGRGTRRITEAFKPDQPQVYNVQQAIRRGETRTAEKSMSNPPESNVSRARNFGRGETQAPTHPAENNVWRATTFGRGETQSAWTLTSSQLANNNVWRETGSARGQTQAAWSLSSNERANSNVWRATNSGIGERGAGVTVRPNQPTNNNLWGSTRSGRPGNWRSGESGAQ